MVVNRGVDTVGAKDDVDRLILPIVVNRGVGTVGAKDTVTVPSFPIVITVP